MGVSAKQSGSARRIRWLAGRVVACASACVHEVNYLCTRVYFLRRRQPKRVLLVTDSRGLNLKKAPFLTYPDLLSCQYACTCILHPEKWTTVADVYRILEPVATDYDTIIIHVGISDFSPRQYSIAKNQIYATKKTWYDKLFGEVEMSEHMASHLSETYEGDFTTTMISVKLAAEKLAPWLNSLKNLIFVTGNQVLTSWRGDYFRPRPANIGLTNIFFLTLDSHLKNAVSFMHWDECKIKLLTTDSIHLNKRGHREVFRAIVARLEQRDDREIKERVS